MSALLAGTVGWLAPIARANDASTARAKDALKVCNEVDRMPADKQKKIDFLDKGVEMGEAAIAADDEDPRAHFALFCNLAKQCDMAGLSWRILGRLRRMQAEIDRAYELAPRDPDILVSRGELLRRLPGPLGGDKEKGERLLFLAVEIKPDHVAARLYLARALADDGAPEARAKAYEALALAKKAGAVREQAEAQELLASLND
ncbi:MAG TPA: hypothetical protein VMS22_14910 [Candidatus Eisenbacteria bacterium]|nr:hypothetical protein [Candidatus Eisenbacteria bacterium]